MRSQATRSLSSATVAAVAVLGFAWPVACGEEESGASGPGTGATGGNLADGSEDGSVTEGGWPDAPTGGAGGGDATDASDDTQSDAALDAGGDGDASAPRKALELDGVDDVVVIPGSKSLNLLSAMTVEAWIKTTTNPAKDTAVVGKHLCGVSAGWFIGLNSYGAGGKPANVAQYFVDHDPRLAGSTSLADGLWHHLAGTWDGTTMTLYVDGVAVSQANSYSAGSNVEIAFGIHGNVPSCSGNHYAGRLDEVSVWGVARTAAQIAQDKSAALAGNEAGLLAYWKLDETAGQTVDDHSPNGWHGVLGSSAASGADDPSRVEDGPF